MLVPHTVKPSFSDTTGMFTVEINIKAGIINMFPYSIDVLSVDIK